MADDTEVHVDVAVACRVLGVSRSGYYDWLGRPPSAREEANTLLLKQITGIHEQSRGTYGWPRIHAELVLGLGVEVNHKRVARLMREAGIRASTGAGPAAARSGRRPRTTWCTASSPSTPRTGSG
jgi:transposase InsO family protein